MMSGKEEDLLNIYGQSPDTNYEETIVLEGELTNSNAGGSSDAPNFDTLNEPIKETILRDLKAVGMKFKHVIIPTEKKSLLSDWDLWGPLILCTFMAFMLENSQAGTLCESPSLCNYILSILMILYFFRFQRTAVRPLPNFSR